MRNKPVVVILLAIVIVFIALIGFFLFKNTKSSPVISDIFSGKSSISGKLDVNGVIPNGATTTFTQKELGTDKTAVFSLGIPVDDGQAWSFDNAVSGKSYEIQAQVVVNGSIVTVSSPISVSSPADDETLVLNLTSDEAGSAVISGNIKVSGYIPTGATIRVRGRRLGEQDFTVIARNLPGQPTQFMTYTTAVSGVTYEVDAILVSAKGITIGTSSIIAITAPAVNESLTINSQAPAPTTPAPTQTQSSTGAPQPTAVPASAVSIAGSINFNGAAPANSRIVVLQKPMNGQNYQVAVDNITPTDGTTWTWSGAQNATWYTMIAVLKQRQSNGTDQDMATSSPITIAAPATNVIFTLNSGVGLSAPGGPVTVTCQTYNGGPNQNTWNVQIFFQSIPGAQSYWYEVGLTNGGTELVNTSNNAQTTGQQQISATFNNNTTYYARYAYANVPNATTGSSQYSGFSSTTPLQCSH